MTKRSRSGSETKRLGRELAGRILRGRPGHAAQVIALMGDLGSGKTTFAQGFARGLGLRRRPTSPTFILVRRHGLKHKYFHNLFHIDAYRIHSPRELTNLGLKSVFRDPENIVLVEWADKIRKVLPAVTRWVKFAHGPRAHERVIQLPRI